MVYMFLTFLNFLHINNKKNNEQKLKQKIEKEIKIQRDLFRIKKFLILNKNSNKIEDVYEASTNRKIKFLQKLHALHQANEKFNYNTLRKEVKDIDQFITEQARKK